MVAKISIAELCLCCFPLLSKYTARRKQPVPYFIFYLFSFFFFLFFSYFFREKLKATDAIKGVAHFMGFTIGALKTFLFSRKTFCKNQHVNKKPLQPRRPRRYFLAAVSLASR